MGVTYPSCSACGRSAGPNLPTTALEQRVERLSAQAFAGRVLLAAVNDFVAALQGAHEVVPRSCLPAYIRVIDAACKARDAGVGHA